MKANQNQNSSSTTAQNKKITPSVYCCIDIDPGPPPCSILLQNANEPEANNFNDEEAM